MKKLAALLLIFFLFFGHPQLVLSQAPAPAGQTQAERLQEIRRQITETETLLSETRQKKATLQNEITFQNNQIKLTELKIAETEEEIATLTGQIERLEGVLGELSRVFATRAVETYKLKRLGDPLILLLGARNLSEFMLHFQYLQRIQQADRELLLKMQTAQTNYEDQRSEVEALHEKLEAQKATLARQRAQKQQLLAVTQNDEKKYQGLLATLRADLASITQALSNIGAKIGKVSKGEVIGSVGSSGCSTGPHLHFEVFTDAKVEGGKFVGNRVNPKPYLEDGKYEKPVPNYPGNVTTWYGEVYFLGTHTGIDIANPFNTDIKAIADGEAYFTSAPCNYNIKGGTPLGKGIVVDHQNGLVTLYWHIP